MSNPLILAGQVLTGGRFIEGFVIVEDGTVAAVEEGRPTAPPDGEGVILPGLVNHHTHVGDAAVPPPPEHMGPAEVFRPPSGYKHEMLRTLSEDQLEGGTAAFLDDMTAAGVVEHVDFREGGMTGIRLLERARGRASFPPRSLVLGRPSTQEYDAEELDSVLAACGGLGLSAAMDMPWPTLCDVVAHARSMGAPVALHCSETKREDLSRVLELEPAFLVHMVHGTPEDFRDLAAAGVPVVACPRSTARFTRAPPVVDMVRGGVEVRLGTDNAMLQGPDPLEEVAFLLAMPDVRGVLDSLEVLSWALPASKGSNTVRDYGVSPGSSELVLFSGSERDPLALAQAGHLGEVSLVLRDGQVWRR